MTRTAGTIGSTAVAAWRNLFLIGALLLAVAATASLGLAQQTNGERLTVDDVLIIGLRSISTEQVKAQLRTVPGQPYNEAFIQEDLRRLGEMRTFKPPRVETQMVPGAKSVKVFFIVEEYPNVVREVLYKNAHHAKTEELEAITGIKRGLPLNPGSNLKACLNIVDYYKKEGRYFASCKLEEGGNPTDTRVVFNITEGPVVRFRYITFTGNDTLATTARLRTQIDTWQRFLWFELLGSKFEPARVDSDAAKLAEYYKTNGYLDVRVTRELRFTDDHQFVDVVFHISEGLHYHVQDVSVKGSQALPQDQVLSILALHKGDKYDERTIDKDIRNITDLYGYRGYQTIVDKKLVFADKAVEPGVVRVEYQVVERTPAKVGEIVIVGNDVTKQRVILRQLRDIYPGQTLSYPALKAGEAALARSNLFDMEDRPTLSVIDRFDNPDSEYKDILVKVKETMTGSLMFGASVNSDAGLVGSIVLNERNFDICNPPTSIEDIWEGRAWRGGGQEFRIEAVPGTQVQRYSASWREPYLFDLPYSLSTSVYYFQRSYNEDLETRTGFNVAVGHQLNRYWNASVGVRVENVNISNVPPYAPPDYTSVIGDNFLVAPRVTVARDDRDSFLRPTEGGLIQATYEQLLGEFTAPLLTLSASRYFTTWQRNDGSGRQVLMLRSQVAWAGEETPVYERYFAGGIQSMRGFQFRGVGPFINGFNVGGDFMWLNSIEYQIPILANDMVYLVGFVDSGTVEQNVSVSDYRVSAGFGARIIVPMLGQVPIALDFGFPIVRGPDDRTQLFSFYVGVFK
jgi:outer membrane protein assembly complex protein YaeT